MGREIKNETENFCEGLISFSRDDKFIGEIATRKGKKNSGAFIIFAQGRTCFNLEGFLEKDAMGIKNANFPQVIIFERELFIPFYCAN